MPRRCRTTQKCARCWDLSGSPQLLRVVCGCQVPKSRAHQPHHALALHQHLLVGGVTWHAPSFREPDAEKPARAGVAASLGFCEAVQVAPPQVLRSSWTQERQWKETNSQLVTATARATSCSTGVRKSLGIARAHDLCRRASRSVRRDRAVHSEVTDCPADEAWQPLAGQLRDTCNVTYCKEVLELEQGSGVASGRGRQDVCLEEVLRGCGLFPRRAWMRLDVPASKSCRFSAAQQRF